MKCSEPLAKPDKIWLLFGVIFISNPLIMDATLLATLVGVLTGVVSSFITHYFQVRLERQRMLLQAQTNSRKEFKLEIAETVKTIMAMIHEVAWTSWEVSKGKADKESLAAYDERAKQNLTLMSEKLALIAATDIATYEQVRAIAQSVYSLDVELAEALVEFSEGNIPKENFGQIKQTANTIEKELPQKFADILRSVDEILV